MKITEQEMKKEILSLCKKALTSNIDYDTVMDLAMDFFLLKRKNSTMFDGICVTLPCFSKVSDDILRHYLLDREGYVDTSQFAVDNETNKRFREEFKRRTDTIKERQ